MLDHTGVFISDLLWNPYELQGGKYGAMPGRQLRDTASISCFFLDIVPYVTDCIAAELLC